MLDGVKYLGIVLDPKLGWNQHLEIIRKTQNKFALVIRTCGKKCVLRPGALVLYQGN
jgi:hypothetical protein